MYFKIEGRPLKSCSCGTDRHMPRQCENLFSRIFDGIKKTQEAMQPP